MPPKAKPAPAAFIPPLLPATASFRCQPRVVDLLERSLRRGKLRGALLITGERGLGKTTLAVAIARALSCERNRDENGTARQGFWYCDECYACRSIATGNQPELAFIRPQKKEIGVTQLREEQDNLAQAALHPVHLSHRIFIFDEAHLISDELGNRLLKLLEEPPERSVFMLVTDKPHRLLPTIRSRGQILALMPASMDLLRTELAQDLPQAEAHVIAEAARMSAGRYVQARGLARSKEWRAAVKALAAALSRGRGYGPEAKELAGFELAAIQSMHDEDRDSELTRERRNEQQRAALIAAFQRAAWWMCCTGWPQPGLLSALTRLRLRIDSNVDASIAQAALEAELWLGARPLNLRHMLDIAY